MDAVVRRAIERVLEIELARGESETIASPIAQVLRYSGGRDVLVRILCAIGRDPKLQRTYTSGAASQGKLAVFSHLIRVTMPGKGDSLAAFAADVKAEKISENVLLAVAFYAPRSGPGMFRRRSAGRCSRRRSGGSMLIRRTLSGKWKCMSARAGMPRSAS